MIDAIKLYFFQRRLSLFDVFIIQFGVSFVVVHEYLFAGFALLFGAIISSSMEHGHKK